MSYIDPRTAAPMPVHDEVGALAAAISPGRVSARLPRDLSVSVVGGSVAVQEPDHAVLERMLEDGLLHSEGGQHCLHSVTSQIWLTPLAVSKHGDALWAAYRAGGGDLDCPAFKLALAGAAQAGI